MVHLSAKLWSKNSKPSHLQNWFLVPPNTIMALGNQSHTLMLWFSQKEFGIIDTNFQLFPSEYMHQLPNTALGSFLTYMRWWHWTMERLSSKEKVYILTVVVFLRIFLYSSKKYNCSQVRILQLWMEAMTILYVYFHPKNMGKKSNASKTDQKIIN